MTEWTKKDLANAFPRGTKKNQLPVVDVSQFFLKFVELPPVPEPPESITRYLQTSPTKTGCKRKTPTTQATPPCRKRKAPVDPETARNTRAARKREKQKCAYDAEQKYQEECRLRDPLDEYGIPLRYNLTAAKQQEQLELEKIRRELSAHQAAIFAHQAAVAAWYKIS
jgi:hypothetical protein